MVNRFLSSLLFLAAVNTGIAQAQIIPDGTLPTVVEQLENMRKITGGERVGNNLFHSFESFSILEGIEAIFENALEVENIFTRITGQDISIIDGLLQTAGGANFFLINPNGIVFGENASLDVGGSFIATTANSIEFADGTSFAASHPKVSLTISVPIGLGLDGNNGSITVNGTGNQIKNESSFSPVEFSERPTGLSVNDGNTLALIGNGLNFNGGVVTTEGGNIYLTSVSSGSVGISLAENELTLIDDSVNNYQDINLNQQSLVDGSGEKVGTISLIGKNVNLSDASFVLAQNEGDSLGGSINIKANESINLSGNSPDGNIASAIRSEILSSGEREGTSINISANQLVFEDQGKIRTNSYSLFGDSASGNINIQVSDLIQISDSSIGTNSFNAGNAGNIQLSTSELQILNGGIINSTTTGAGKGGEININANLIEVVGGDETSRSAIAASSTSSFNTGNAGTLKINTSNLQVKDGASISTSSFNAGNAGNLIINASESIEVSGDNETLLGTPNPQSIVRSAVQPVSPAAQQVLGLPAVPTGDAGSLTINTPILNVTQGGVISVENQGTGNAGTLTINADTLNLDEAGNITATAESGLGGNIELKTQDLNISNDSQITTTAGGDSNGGNITINTTNLTAKKNTLITANATSGDGGNIIINADSVSLNDRDTIAAASSSGDGGNITINTDTLTALERSKITANAVSGDGGNITINTRGYFISEDSVVSASSEFGLDGTIIINSLENSFQQEIEESEIEIVTIPDFFTPRCANPDRAYLTLNPGQYLPENPDNYYSYPTQTRSESLISPELEAKLELLAQELSSREEIETETEETESTLIWQPGEPIVNATEIVETEDGRVFLVPAEQKQERMQKLKCGQSLNGKDK